MTDNVLFSGKKITILGAGVSGLSLARLAAKLGARVFLSEASNMPGEAADKLISEGMAFEDGGHTEAALDCDFAVASSGFPPCAKIASDLSERGVRVCGELDFVRPHLRGRLIGITGSNGKTTTTSLAGHLLKSAGLRVAVAGNIGNPIANAAGEQYDFIVAELSSFQLHRAETFALDAAIVTNLAPDHIDWHGTYQKYIEAKARILQAVGENGYAVVRECDADALGARGAGTYTLSWGASKKPNAIILNEKEGMAALNGIELFRFADTDLLGKHNMENVAMALSALCLLGVEPSGVRGALGSYTPPPHRCAFVAEVNGVTYVDDSKGTNVAASETALASLPGKKVVILGGKGKGEDYGRLADSLRKNAIWAILIGEAAAEIAESLRTNGYTKFTVTKDMQEAVTQATSKARRGDMVLLSPACTSWDMYNNYGERGDHFASLVRELEHEAERTQK